MTTAAAAHALTRIRQPAAAVVAAAVLASALAGCGGSSVPVAATPTVTVIRTAPGTTAAAGATATVTVTAAAAAPTAGSTALPVSGSPTPTTETFASWSPPQDGTYCSTTQIPYQLGGYSQYCLHWTKNNEVWRHDTLYIGPDGKGHAFTPRYIAQRYASSLDQNDSDIAPLGSPTLVFALTRSTPGAQSNPYTLTGIGPNSFQTSVTNRQGEQVNDTWVFVPYSDPTE